MCINEYSLLMEKFNEADLNAVKFYERAEGREEHLIELVRKKIEAGKDIQTIAAEVEESVEKVRPIYNELTAKNSK